LEERPFLDKKNKPTEQVLQQVFGDLSSCYTMLMDITDSFLKDWNFSKRSGWMLKVHHKKKALFYLIPLKNEFVISMAIRENERKAFLDDDKFKTIHDMIKSAKKYREGFALRFNVNNNEDCEILESFIKKLVTFRS